MGVKDQPSVRSEDRGSDVSANSSPVKDAGAGELGQDAGSDEGKKAKLDLIPS